MEGTSAVGNQASAQYTRASKDLPHDGDADEQKVKAEAAAKASQENEKTNPSSGNPKGVGGNMDVVV